MKFLKKFLRKKDVVILHKSINSQQYLDYDDNHDAEDYTDRDKKILTSVFRSSMIANNTSSFVTVVKKSYGLIITDPFFQIKKYKDEMYIVHVSKIDLSKKVGFEVMSQYLCDTLDGVVQILKLKI